MDAVKELKNTVARLRGPGGCPWDREQTHQSLTECLVEETAELLDTIDRLDMEHMREELGDVLLQVIFHAQLAEEAEEFNLADVARDINEKLIRRHPHVFGEHSLQTSEQVLQKWEEIKAAEKADKPQKKTSPFSNLPPALPSLLYAKEVYKRLVKNDLISASSVSESELEEVSKRLDEETVGAELFKIAAACRKAGIDPESALRRHCRRVVQEAEDGQPN